MPALKMPSIAEQLASVVINKATIAKGKYLFVIIMFVFLLLTTHDKNGFSFMGYYFTLSNSTSKIRVL